jgi:hypothetical protein
MSLALFSEIKEIRAAIKGLRESFEILAERLKALEEAEVPHPMDAIPKRGPGRPRKEAAQ